MSIKKGIDKTVQGLVSELEKRARPIEGRDDIKVVASIYAGNDEFVGTTIADAIDKVGLDGVLSIESSSSFETTVEVEEGIKEVVIVDLSSNSNIMCYILQSKLFPWLMKKIWRHHLITKSSNSS